MLKNCSRSLFVAASLFLTSSTALAAPTINSPAVGPSSIPVNSATSVTFTASLTDPSFNTSGINLVLMDVMMPEMDGLETIRAIRKRAKFKTMPIIALTAKAMKGDRESCMDAGASDYIAKPVDTEQLLSLLRVWLYR